MEISRDDIVLRKINADDIELIRNWRNGIQVKQFMEFQEHISEEDQLTWYKSINNSNNLYFLIIANKTPVGLIHGASINWENKSIGNAGIFIGEEAIREDKYAFNASILLNDFAFNNGFKKIFIKIMNNNPLAIAYNKWLGYVVVPDTNNGLTTNYVLTEEDYLKARKKIEYLLTNTPYKVKYTKEDEEVERQFKAIND